ncbi:uncharacterized protein LOC124551028 isoform X1 [Schistocerca americana]|uniref:uncharacterized protein LOC124551028 isoform X1 n=2 Tax=Schistocerca TaxID=7008 RepID=UPI001F4FCE53|nr:uncharacterized protein LOC124551028 isoform X1 [Schistocerca americana]XP_046981833.1 uncharacterized protein LOC124551028 isoform X1 [Schistocerca americana]
MSDSKPEQSCPDADELMLAGYTRVESMRSHLDTRMQTIDTSLATTSTKLQDIKAWLIRENKEQRKKAAQINRELQNLQENFMWADESLSTDDSRLQNEITLLTREKKELLKRMGVFMIVKKELLKMLALHKKTMKKRTLVMELMESADNHWSRVRKSLLHHRRENCKQNDENLVPDTDTD